ncbi:MAG: hypothetical protein KJ623_01635 [Nanoarchaeota archaeon]|nr:hypothetical protein [Nanoarchaeota archaeon]MBU0962764.1 hypothetical protein [Nanoarchaeota archaeon]
MKKGLLLLIFVLCSITVSALDLTGSKYSSDIYKIKFDDNPSILVFNKSLGTNFGCGADGKFFVKFDVDSAIHDSSKIQLYYRLFSTVDYDHKLNGEYYKRNLQTGKFDNVSSKLFSSMTYYFFSDPMFTNNNYVIKTINLDGQNREKIFYIHCPAFRYNCENIKPEIICYNTNDEKLVIEISGLNIDENEKFDLSDLQIYTKGTNQRSNLLDNTLASDAVMEKVGDKYIITSSLLYGNEDAGTNIIDYVYFQPKNCIYDMYPDAYVTQKCQGIKEVSSDTNEVTGNVIADVQTSNNYWIYGIIGLVFILVLFLVFRKKKI